MAKQWKSSPQCLHTSRVYRQRAHRRSHMTTEGRKKKKNTSHPFATRPAIYFSLHLLSPSCFCRFYYQFMIVCYFNGTYLHFCTVPFHIFSRIFDDIPFRRFPLLSAFDFLALSLCILARILGAIHTHARATKKSRSI